MDSSEVHRPCSKALPRGTRGAHRAPQHSVNGHGDTEVRGAFGFWLHTEARAVALKEGAVAPAATVTTSSCLKGRCCGSCINCYTVQKPKRPRTRFCGKQSFLQEGPRQGKRNRLRPRCRDATCVAARVVCCLRVLSFFRSVLLAGSCFASCFVICSVAWCSCGL